MNCSVTNSAHSFVALDESAFHPSPSLDVCLLCGETVVRYIPETQAEELELALA